MRYIWERAEWPTMRWDAAALVSPLAAVRHAQGRLLGRMEALGFGLRDEAALQTLTRDVVGTSAIEGEALDARQVRSSLARRLGIDAGGVTAADRNVEGIVEVMLDATRNYARPLTEARLFDWHAALFPTGRSGMRRIGVARWRDDASGRMQVISGPVGSERVHYTAPPASRVADEMARLLAWIETPTALDPLLVAAQAHLWFVTIHPFEDGNGRLARAIADLALARSEASPQRFYSMSAQIRVERGAYYDALERAQQGDGDVTGWVLWFLACLGRAIDGAQGTLAKVLHKAACWSRWSTATLNPRQTKVLTRVLDGLDGSLTSSKWAKLAGCSQDTAARDIADLVATGILRRGDGGGRSTHYVLVDPAP